MSGTVDVRKRLPLALVVAATPLVLLAQEPRQWTFDDTPAMGSRADGLSGKALVVAAGASASYDVAGACTREGTLSFYYRLPAEGDEDGLTIVRLGEHALTYEKRRLRWYRPADGEAGRKASIPVHSALSRERFVLIEVGWSVKQRAVIFAAGRLVSWMGTFELPETENDSVKLVLGPGTFDEMQLEPDATAAGGRYRGVLVLERLDRPDLPQYWKWYNRGGIGVRLIPGFNGTSGAMATPPSIDRYVRFQLPLGYFRVSEDMWLCGAFYSGNGHAAHCMVRTWPKLEKHPNHWLRRSIPAGKWHAEKIPLARFALVPGHIAQGVSFGSYKVGERYVAADNVCLIRGRDTIAPKKVPHLEAKASATGVHLKWARTTDDICVVGYVVFWSNVPKFERSDDEVVCRTLDTSFTHEYVTHAGTWYYAVAAIDLFDNVGPISDVVCVTVGGLP